VWWIYSVGWNRGALGGTEWEEEARDEGGVVAPSTGKDDGGEERRRQGADIEGRDDDAAEVTTVMERGAEDEEDWVARHLSQWAGGGRRQMQREVGGDGRGVAGMAGRVRWLRVSQAVMS
jgi:hypothetical protein